jgi:localization factor PodJL
MRSNIDEMHRNAKAGSCVAQTFLGLSYLHGYEVEVNLGEAFKFLSAAANQGGSRATIGLASMYAKGLGVPRNLIEAIRLFESVAAPPNGSDAFTARIELARLYLHGSGIPVDVEKAANWYEAAIAISTGKEDPEDLREARSHLGKVNDNH